MTAPRHATILLVAGLALGAGAQGIRVSGPPAPTLPPRSGDAGPRYAIPGAPEPPAAGRRPAAAVRTVAPAPAGVVRSGPVFGTPAPAVRTAPVVRSGPVFGAPYSPYVSGVNYRSDGTVGGYHVVAPAVEENPFAIFPQGRAAAVGPAVAPPPPPPPVVVVETREAVALPSSAVCEAREQAELDAILADPSVVRPTVSCGEEVFRRDALGLVRSQYRAAPRGLVPASDIEISAAGVVRRKVRSETNAWPQPTDAQILAAFRAGGRFIVVRRRDVSVTCGMCEGSGAVVRERVANPATGVVRAVTGSCPRCGGKGRRARPVDALYTIVNSETTETP